MAGLDGARELGDGEHRDIEIAGQYFQTAGDLGHLLLAVLRTVASFATDHELQVVHDDERERHLAGDVELAGGRATLAGSPSA